eukprot:768610-Hanusia_phi.AAC.4
MSRVGVVRVVKSSYTGLAKDLLTHDPTHTLLGLPCFNPVTHTYPTSDQRKVGPTGLILRNDQGTTTPTPQQAFKNALVIRRFELGVTPLNFPLPLNSPASTHPFSNNGGRLEPQYPYASPNASTRIPSKSTRSQIILPSINYPHLL